MLAFLSHRTHAPVSAAVINGRSNIARDFELLIVAVQNPVTGTVRETRFVSGVRIGGKPQWRSHRGTEQERQIECILRRCAIISVGRGGLRIER